jgi:3',5'-cyclic AMP phosphodiesterase CpdA
MFVLAHLSDPHLGPLPKPRLRDLTGKRATGYFNWWRGRSRAHRGDVLARIVADLKAQRPDHIAVTGDLVNISLAGEFAPARTWLDTLGTPHGVTLVPGNHDFYVRNAAGAPAAHWGEFMGGDVACASAAPRNGPSRATGLRPATHADGLKFPFLRRRGPLALIGLSSALPTAFFLATGRLGAAQLSRLAEMLDDCGREGLFRVVLVHHPPLSRRSRYFKRLTDGAALRATLARHGGELLLHGHDHEHSVMALAGPEQAIPAVGVPSASEIPTGGGHDRAAYNLYRIDGTSGAWRCEAISRGISADGETVTEIRRTVLCGGAA